jgi:hypothetical protein
MPIISGRSWRRQILGLHRFASRRVQGHGSRGRFCRGQLGGRIQLGNGPGVRGSKALRLRLSTRNTCRHANRYPIRCCKWPRRRDMGADLVVRIQSTRTPASCTAPNTLQGPARKMSSTIWLTSDSLWKPELETRGQSARFPQPKLKPAPSPRTNSGTVRPFSQVQLSMRRSLHRVLEIRNRRIFRHPSLSPNTAGSPRNLRPAGRACRSRLSGLS